MSLIHEEKSGYLHVGGGTAQGGSLGRVLYLEQSLLLLATELGHSAIDFFY